MNTFDIRVIKHAYCYTTHPGTLRTVQMRLRMKRLYQTLSHFSTPIYSFFAHYAFLLLIQGLIMDRILLCLLIRSFADSPHMPLSYHLETLVIARRLLS
jgi:hypothetical protein